MRRSQQSAVMWHHRYSWSLPLSAPVYQTMPWHIPNYHSLWMFQCWIHTAAYLPELCIQQKSTNTKVYIFLVSVTGMYLNQLDKIFNALWNISHTTLSACEVPVVSQCTNLVLWILHFGTVSAVCTDGHKIKPYLKQNGWHHTSFLLLLLSRLHYYFLFFLWGRNIWLKQAQRFSVKFPTHTHTLQSILVPQCCICWFWNNSHCTVAVKIYYLPSYKISDD